MVLTKVAFGIVEILVHIVSRPKIILVAPITFGGKQALQTPNLLEVAGLCQSLGVTTANNGIFRKGKLQQQFFSKYTWNMWKLVFVLSRIRSGALRTLCELKDVGYS